MTAGLLGKLQAAIERIESKPRPPQAEQYALLAAQDGQYPIYERGNPAPVGVTHLNQGDVWEYGFSTKAAQDIAIPTSMDSGLNTNLSLEDIAQRLLSKRHSSFLTITRLTGSFRQEIKTLSRFVEMNVGITMATDPIVRENGKTDIIQKLSNSIKSFFTNLSYGADIKEFVIHVICLDDRFGFHKIKRPLYVKGKKTARAYGQLFQIEDSFSYNIKLDENVFPFVSQDEARHMLVTAILDTVGPALASPKKLVDFNRQAFIADLRQALTI